MKTTTKLRAALGAAAVCLTFSAHAITQSDFDRANALWAQDREAEAVQLLQSAVDAEPAAPAGQGSALLTQGYWLLAKAKLKTKPQRLEDSARDFLKARMLGFERQHPERSLDVSSVARRYSTLLGQQNFLRLQVEVAQALGSSLATGGTTPASTLGSQQVVTAVLTAAPTAPRVAPVPPQVLSESSVSVQPARVVDLAETTVAWARSVDRVAAQVPLLPELKTFVLGKDAERVIEQYALFYLMVCVSLLLAIFRLVLAAPRLVGAGLTLSTSHIGTVNSGVQGAARAVSCGSTVPPPASPTPGEPGGFRNVTRASAQSRRPWR